MATEVYACMFRKNDPAFKTVVDRSLTQLMKSGDILKDLSPLVSVTHSAQGLNLTWPAPDGAAGSVPQPRDIPLN